MIETTMNVTDCEMRPNLRNCLILYVTVIFITLFMCGMASGRTLAKDELAKLPSPGGYQPLADKIKKTGAIRVIVRVDAQFQPLGDPVSEASHHQQRRISTTQDALLSALAPFNAKKTHKYQYVPYVAMEVDEPALQALLASPEVLQVQEDRLSFPSLDLSVPRIGAPTLWGQGYSGQGIAVAVLDTGVDKSHPFLSGAVVSEACFSTNYVAGSASSLCPGGVTASTATGSALPYAGNCPAGQCNHGTHVSGIIAGRNGITGSPGPGVAPAADIIAIQVFTRFEAAACGGSSPCVGAYDSDLIKGLERVYALRSTYAIASVNMSLGGGSYSGYCDAEPLKAIIDTLKEAGIASIIATGNSSTCGTISVPACISSAISVGATTDSDTVASYSNSASFMSLLAPGSSINSSIPGGSYASWNGTSMATPHVAGAWALMKQAYPGATVDQILHTFSSTGVSITDTGKCGSVTKKRINVSDAYPVMTAAPTVIVTKPATGAVGVPLDNAVTAVFSRAMNAATLTTTTVTLVTGATAITGAVNFNAASQTVTFTPSSSLVPGTTYTATITTGATDATGTPLAAPYSWAFTTAAGSLAAALDTPVAVTSDGNATWFSQSAVTHDGSDAAQAGSITHLQSTWMEAIVVGPGPVSFWWKVSSQAGFDGLLFYVDGVAQAWISGEVNWALKSYTLSSGTHVLRWAYTKDEVLSSGSDTGWVDQLVLPSHTITTTAGSNGSITPTVTVDYGATATVSVTPTTGYHIASILVDDVSQAITDPKHFSFTFTNVTANHTVNVTFAIDTVSVTVQSNPANLNIIVDGISYATTQAFTWDQGSSHTLSTVSPQNGATGIRYLFTSWSDGAGMSRTVTAPVSGSATYTANFITQYQLTTAVSPAADGFVLPVTGNWYAADSVVNVSVIPNTGKKIGSWTGPVTAPNSAATTVIMTGPLSVTANLVGVPALTAKVTGKSGSDFANRVWTFTMSNSGTGTATNVKLTNMTVTSTTCSPKVKTGFPLPVANVASGLPQSGAVTIDVSGCTNTSKLSVGFSYSYGDGGSGSFTGSNSLYNLLR